MLFRYPLNPDPDDAAKPVVGWFCDEIDPKSYPAHRHRRAQILHAARGPMIVSAEDKDWVVPPHRAIWIPGGVEHSVVYPKGVALRTLYIDTAAISADLPSRLSILHLDPLARELLRASAELPWESRDRLSDEHLFSALFDRLVVQMQRPLHLPDARDKRLMRVMDALRADPADNRTLEGFALLARCSKRTLARLFVEETGMSFGAWRQQLRLLAALEELAAGGQISQIALSLGYESAGSFSTMFRRGLGRPPARYFDH